MTPLPQRISKLQGAQKVATEERDSIYRDIHELKRDERQNASTIAQLKNIASAWQGVMLSANSGVVNS